MTDPMKKWAQGDEWEPSASWINMVTEAALQVQQALGRPTLGDGQLWQPFTPLRMYNNTGAAIPQLGVVTYATPMVLPSVNENRFTNDSTVIAIKPAAPLDRFAISLSRVETSGVFWAVCGGVVPCKVTGSGSKVQAIINDVEKLQAGVTGLELIWSESGSSTRFGLVKLFGGGSGCTKKYQLFYLGSASSGSITLPVSAQAKTDGVRSGAYTTENVTIPWNATTTQTKTAIEGHSLIDADEVTVTGSLSLQSANHVIVMPDGTYLGTGGTGELTTTLVRSGLEVPKAYLWECCS